MKKRPFDKNRLLIWIIVFLVITLLAVMNYNRFVTGELAVGKPGKYGFYFIMETTGAYTILLIIPFMVRFIKMFPIRRKNLFARIPLHLLASMVFGVCHTLLMYLSRICIFWIFGLGTYNYGRWEYRLPMEYSHQFLIYWTVNGVVLLLQFIRENQEQKLRTVRLEQKLTQARFQSLQNQLHPHFLFNTLNTISSTMYDDVRTADTMMAGLSDLLRITLDSTSVDEQSLDKELEISELYIRIMKARYKDKLSVRWDIEEETQDALVPGFILQPILENSIKFGMENIKILSVIVSSHKNNNRLRLMVEDNGPGISADPRSIMENGIGLSNTAERLENLYGNQHTFHFQNLDGGGFEVVIDIPFKLPLRKA